MRRALVLGLLLAFAAVPESTQAKTTPHVFTCATDAECAAEWQEIYG